MGFSEISIKTLKLKGNHDCLLAENGELKAEVKELAKDVSRLEREKAAVEARAGK